MIRFNASATSYILMDLNPNLPTAGWAVVITLGKFLITLNFGYSTLYSGYRIEYLRLSNIKGAIYFNDSYQKA